MASTISAITTGSGGIVQTADASGNLSLLSGTTTIVAVTAAGATVTGDLTTTGNTILGDATVTGDLTTTGNTILGDASTDTLNVGNGGLVKDASGNVGIGIATPGAKLDVAGQAKVGAAYNDGLTIVVSGNAITYPTDNTLAFSTFNTERMRIDSSGNVGIGTSSPTAGGKLDVNGFAYFGTGDKLKVYSNNILQNAGTLDIGTIGSAALVFNTANTERARIDSSGNVGIGTASPNAKLHVAGSSTLGGDLTTTGNTILGDATTDTLNVGNGGLVKDASGNVGIGTASPNAKLHVAGSSTLGGVVSIGAESMQYSGGQQCPATGIRELFRVDSSALCTSGFFSISCTRGSYVHSSLWGWASTHNGTGQGTLTQYACGNYTGLTVYLDVHSNGSIIVSADYGDAQWYTLTVNKFAGGAIYTALNGTLWATPGTGYNRYSRSSTQLGFSAANIACIGALSKGSGTFKIDHPLPTLTETHNLIHSFIEGPKADLIYRGKTQLVNGVATVNIDDVATMTEGTFELLCRDTQCFTTNETDWTSVRGAIVGNILTIECQDTASTATISWMVIGERKDKHMYDTEWTDVNGKPIVEPLKNPPQKEFLDME